MTSVLSTKELYYFLTIGPLKKRESPLRKYIKIKMRWKEKTHLSKKN